MPVKDMTPERRKQLEDVCSLLRGMGYAYEDIPDHLAHPASPRLEPWEVYAFCNPGKSMAQVRAWKDRHCASV